MTMNLNIRLVNSVKVIELEGELNSATAPAIHDSVVRQVRKQDRVVLDMTHVTFLSSAGIRTMLLIYRTMRANGGKIVIAGLTEDVENVLSVTGFLEFFVTCRTVEEALTTFRA